LNIFDFSQITQEEVLTFFAVLMRFSVLIAVMPFVGDRMVPLPVKILLALVVTFALFPTLVVQGHIKPGEALVWGATTGGIAGTIACEVLCGLLLGFTARLLFESVAFGANLAGAYMGFAAASIYDPHQESQSQVVAQIQISIAMLIFLALDGHHLMLRASLESYQIVGLGKAAFGSIASARLIDLTSQVIRFGIQLSAPVGLSLFAVNVAFGVIAKAMPQLNILVLSFAVTGLVGLAVMLMCVPEFQGAVGAVLSRMGDWMEAMAAALGGK
jgi:flagellar biosynthetic protein FliR